MILDKLGRRGVVAPVDVIEQVVEGQIKERLQKYLAAAPAPFYVMHMAGRFFEGS